ncbi:MAG: MFS transporter [Myxococcales bacterium]|nr:MFS transporter [Myxococcales bacterium]
MDSKATGERVGLLEKVGYGLGDTASNLYFQFFNLFLFYYYTDVFGLNPASVGTMYLVANLWDAVNDPLMGAIADRVQTARGKYRPFLLWFAVPYGVLGYAIFANPSLGETGKLLFAYATFIGFKMVYTAVNVPYSAMMGVMTDVEEDRVALSTFRFLGAFGGGFVVSLLVRPLVKLFGGGDELVGFQQTMAWFGVVSVGLFLVTYATTKERLQPDEEEGPPLREDLALLLKNRPWLVMMVAAICTLANVAVRGAVTVHYFKYYVGDAGEAVWTLGNAGSPWFLELDVTTIFLSSGTVAFIAGVAFTSVVSKSLGKRNGLITLTLLNAATVFGFFFIPADALGLMFVVNLLGSLLAGPTPALVWALYADVADYGEYELGRRATGLVFSAAMFAQKLGLTIGGAASGWILSAFGFVPNAAQSDEAILGIRLMFSVLPGSLALLNGLVLLAYPLSRADTERMQKQLAARRAA